MEKNILNGGVFTPQDQLYHNGNGESQSDDERRIAAVVAPDEQLAVEGLTAAAHERADDERPQTLGEQMRVLARVYYDPAHYRVSMYLDGATANALIYAARVLAAESEAHAREVGRVGATLPPESYGASNRHHIASRHERIAARLRVVEGNYRAVVSEGGAPQQKDSKPDRQSR